MYNVFHQSVVIASDELGEVLDLLGMSAAKFSEILSASITSPDVSSNQQISAMIGKASGAPSGGDTLSPAATEGGTASNTVVGGPFSGAGTMGSIAHNSAQNAYSGWWYQTTEAERLCLSPSQVGLIQLLQPVQGGITLIVSISWIERG